MKVLPGLNYNGENNTQSFTQVGIFYSKMLPVQSLTIILSADQTTARENEM